ncbi:hypothetical protein Taro_010682 [Colocasia esculenta]|uniref:Uncharacterized protein n=1 Tax=Colocasia esculenta TaxID=4460 RepID=A0A843U874_COLES|nr:hypothetical protein [Colocasia esculenta]
MAPKLRDVKFPFSLWDKILKDDAIATVDPESLGRFIYRDATQGPFAASVPLVPSAPHRRPQRPAAATPIQSHPTRGEGLPVASGQEQMENLLQTMALACLVCHSMDSPSRSFRSYSVSSSEGEGRCSAIVSCLTSKVNTSTNNMMTSKVTPFPIMTGGQGTAGNPRLIRSLAVTREHVRDWNFDEISLDG